MTALGDRTDRQGLDAGAQGAPSERSPLSYSLHEPPRRSRWTIPIWAVLIGVLTGCGVLAVVELLL